MALVVLNPAASHGQVCELPWTFVQGLALSTDILILHESLTSQDPEPLSPDRWQTCKRTNQTLQLWSHPQTFCS